MAPFFRAGTLAFAVFAVGFTAMPGLAQTSKPAAAKAAQADPVMARVNGSEIRRSDVDRAVESLPDQYRQLPPAMLFNGILTQMIDRKLLAQAAEKAKLAGDPEVKQQLADSRDRIMQQAYLRREIEKQLTDDKLKARYDQTIKNQTGPEEVKARHILVSTEAEAKAVIVDLGKGTDFSELAKKKSTDRGATEGGDLGYFTRDKMVPEFAEAAFALKVGEYSKTPVKSQFGWHVIKVDDHRTAPPPSFEESRDELHQAMGQEMVPVLVAGLHKGAKIEQFNPDGTPAAIPPKDAAPKAAPKP